VKETPVPIERTKEMDDVFHAAAWHPNWGGGDPAWQAGLDAVLALAERQIRDAIAHRIRAELVCCEIFQQTHDTPAWERASQGAHSLCYWGEVAARITEDATPRL
jgi:hypothetical protein